MPGRDCSGPWSAQLCGGCGEAGESAGRARERRRGEEEEEEDEGMEVDKHLGVVVRQGDAATSLLHEVQDAAIGGGYAGCWLLFAG